MKEMTMTERDDLEEGDLFVIAKTVGLSPGRSIEIKQLTKAKALQMAASLISELIRTTGGPIAITWKRL